MKVSLNEDEEVMDGDEDVDEDIDDDELPSDMPVMWH